MTKLQGIDGLKAAVATLAETNPAFVQQNLDHFNTMMFQLGGDEKLYEFGTATYQITAEVRVISDVTWVTETLINEGFDKPAASDNLTYLISKAQPFTMRMSVSLIDIDGQNPMDYFIENYEGTEYNQADDSRVEISQILKVVELSREPQFVWRRTSL